MREPCSISSDDCLAPVALGIQGLGYADGTKSARGICWECDQPVCSKCSRRVRRQRKKVRICENCQEVTDFWKTSMRVELLGVKT